MNDLFRDKIIMLSRRQGKSWFRDAVLGRKMPPQRITGLVRYWFRYGQALQGTTFPDPRDQELRDRGIELDWRLNVRRQEMHQWGMAVLRIQRGGKQTWVRPPASNVVPLRRRK